MLHDLDMIVIALACLFHLDLEIPIDHLSIGVE